MSLLWLIPLLAVLLWVWGWLIQRAADLWWRFICWCHEDIKRYDDEHADCCGQCGASCPNS